ncbi:unnamed protein product [Musa acuminata subsp. burmannicoides]
MNKLAANLIFPVASSTSNETFCCIPQSCTSLQTHNGGAWTNLGSPCGAATDASNELVQLASLILRFPRHAFSCSESIVFIFSPGSPNNRLSAVLPIQVMSSLMVYGFIHNQRLGKQIMLKLFLSQIMIFLQSGLFK